MYPMVQCLSLAGLVGPLSPCCETPSLPFGPCGGRTPCQPIPASAILHVRGPGCSCFPGWLQQLVPRLREVEQSRVPADLLSSPELIHWAAGVAQTSVQRPGQGELWVRNFLSVNDQLQDQSLGRNQNPAPGNGPSRSEPGQAGGEAGEVLPAWGRGGGLGSTGGL